MIEKKDNLNALYDVASLQNIIILKTHSVSTGPSWKHVEFLCQQQGHILNYFGAVNSSYKVRFKFCKKKSKLDIDFS